MTNRFGNRHIFQIIRVKKLCTVYLGWFRIHQTTIRWINESKFALHLDELAQSVNVFCSIFNLTWHYKIIQITFVRSVNKSQKLHVLNFLYVVPVSVLLKYIMMICTGKRVSKSWTCINRNLMWKLTSFIQCRQTHKSL